MGRIAPARERLAELVPGRKDYIVWACASRNEVRATVDGVEYELGWARGADGLWTVERAKAVSAK